MALLMKKGDFAKRQKVGASAVSNWAKKGLLVFAADPNQPGKQLVDVEKSELLIRGTIDPTRGRPRAQDAQASGQPTDDQPQGSAPSPIALNGLEAARLDEMRERTTRRRIENEQLLGRLVPLPEYERRAGDLGRLVRERTLGLVRQLSERLAAETDPRTVAAILNDAFDKLFNKVADEIEAAASEESAADAALEAAAAAEDDVDLIDEPAAA